MDYAMQVLVVFLTLVTAYLLHKSHSKWVMLLSGLLFGLYSIMALHWAAGAKFTSGVLIVVSSLIARDITAHREYELALARYAAIIEQSSQAIAFVDVNGLFQTWNKAAERMLGYTSEQVLGRPVWNLAEDLREGIVEFFSQMRTAPGVRKVEVQVSSVTGRQLTLSMVVSPIYGPDRKLSGFALMASDVTRQRALEHELLQLGGLNLTGQLAAGVGHEIRNPMTTVRGFLQLFAAKPELARHRQHFDLVLGELDRANTIITEFLSLARTRAVEAKYCCLNIIIQTLTPLIESDALLSDVTVRMDLGNLPNLYLNEREVRQLILNLCRNGIEAMKGKGGTLAITTTATAAGVLFSVTDEGVGIPQAIREQIGTPFFTTKEKGTGLGLTVCYNIAAHHGADIWFESGAGGTTFYVRFPVH